MNTDKLRDYIVEMASQLIEIRTVNYDPRDYPDKGPDGMESPGMEFKVSDFLEEELKKQGIRYQVFNKEGGRPDLFMMIGQFQPGYRQLMAAAHMDTVPSGSEAWKESPDPFKALIKGDQLFGRGSLDNKGQLASLMGAALLLKEKEEEIKGGIILAAVSDEEVGGCGGLQKVLKEKKIKPTDSIIPDVGLEMKNIVVGEKGRCCIEIICEGITAHGSTPYLGKSAISGISHFVDILDQTGLYYEPDPLFSDGTTYNLGLIKGGDAPNMVAAKVSLVVDIRYIPSQKAQDIVEQFENIAKKAKERMEGINYRIILREDTQPMLVSTEAPLVRKLMEITGASPIGIGGGTVSKLISKYGIVSVGFGPGDGKYFHVADERVQISQLVNFAQIIADIGLNLADQRVD